jgi:ATP-dependent exoDNAse (exonuclease V) beta subunit
VTAALAAPLMKAAAAAGPELRRECALVLKLKQDTAIESATIDGVTVEGVTVEGVVDLAFPERIAGDPKWVVVDFKTDADIAGRLDEYRVQLLLYLRAISLSTGAPARGVLMCV